MRVSERSHSPLSCSHPRRKAFPIALRHATLVAESLDPASATSCKPWDNPYTALLAGHGHQGQQHQHQPAAAKGKEPREGSGSGSISSRRGWGWAGWWGQGAAVSTVAKAKQVASSSGATTDGNSVTTIASAATGGGKGSPALAGVDLEATTPCTCGNCGRGEGGLAPVPQPQGSSTCSADDRSRGDGVAHAPAGPLPCGDEGGAAGAGNAPVGGGAAHRSVCVDMQEHLELSLLHVFVEALFGVAAEDFPGEDTFQGSPDTVSCARLSAFLLLPVLGDSSSGGHLSTTCRLPYVLRSLPPSPIPYTPNGSSWHAQAARTHHHALAPLHHALAPLQRIITTT